MSKFYQDGTKIYQKANFGLYNSSVRDNDYRTLVIGYGHGPGHNIDTKNYDVQLKVIIQNENIGLTDDEYNNWVEKDLRTDDSVLTYSGTALTNFLQRVREGIHFHKDKNFRIRMIWVGVLKSSFWNGGTLFPDVGERDYDDQERVIPVATPTVNYLTYVGTNADGNKQVSIRFRAAPISHQVFLSHGPDTVQVSNLEEWRTIVLDEYKIFVYHVFKGVKLAATVIYPSTDVPALPGVTPRLYVPPPTEGDDTDDDTGSDDSGDDDSGEGSEE